MSSTLLAVALVTSLSAMHLHIRRHAGWTASATGRSYIFLGYPLAAFAAFWLTSASTALTWDWALGCAWALAAALSFTAGLGALKRVTAAHATRAVEMETIEPATGAIPR